MAGPVRLSDVIIPEVYNSYGEVNNPELTAFLQSGIVATNPVLDEFMASRSKSGHVPYWTDLDPTIEPNYRNDDPTDFTTPQKIGTAELAVRKAYLHQSWSEMDLVGELLRDNPMEAIKRRTSVYWLRHLQRRVIAIAKGVLAKNVATNSGDMRINIASETISGQSASTRINSTAVLNAAFTMGDAAGGFVGIAMHSATALQLEKNDSIATIRDSDGKVVMKEYKGLFVIIDDSMPIRAGTTDGFVYTSVLFGPGAIGMGTGTPVVPTEVWRNPDAGNGGGMEIFHERKNWLLHPLGHDWVEGSLVDFSPSLAELAQAAHWARKYVRKQVPMAFIDHN